MPTVSLFCEYCGQRQVDAEVFPAGNKWRFVCRNCSRSVDYEPGELHLPPPPVDSNELLLIAQNDAEREWLQAGIAQMQSLLEADLVALQALGLPLPVARDPFRVERKADGLHLHAPSYVRPTTEWFCLDPLRLETEEYYSLDTPAQVGLGVYDARGVQQARTYTIFYEPEELPEEVRAVLPNPQNPQTYQLREAIYRYARKYGLEAVLRSFPNGVWHNRFPYGLFEFLSSVQMGEPKGRVLSNLTIAPLREIAPLALAEVKTVKHRLQFFEAYFTDWNGEPLNKFGNFFDAPLPVVTRGFWSDVKMPSFALPADAARYKLLPPTEYKLALTAPFFAQLARYTIGLFTLSFVADGDTSYLELVCGQADCAQIERQLKIHFPETLVHPAPLREEGGEACQLLNHWAYTGDLHSSFKTLRDFPLDPLAHLFTIAETLAPGERFAVEFFLAPMPNETLAEVVTYYHHKTEHLTKTIEHKKNHYEDTKEEKEELANWQTKMAQVNKKKPAFAVRVRLQATSERLYEQLRDEYLFQYNSPERHWDEPSPFDNDPNYLLQNVPRLQWRLLSAEELAALIHFPMPEAQAEHFERATMQLGEPPSAYTEPV